MLYPVLLFCKELLSQRICSFGNLGFRPRYMYAGADHGGQIEGKSPHSDSCPSGPLICHIMFVPSRDHVTLCDSPW